MTLGKVSVLLAVLMLAGCASGPPNVATDECDVSWIDRGQLSPVRACELRVLAKRCAVSDRCQIQCERRGGASGIGGGCGHVCTGGGGGQTDEDIARNGGPYATKESVACYNRMRNQGNVPVPKAE